MQQHVNPVSHSEANTGRDQATAIGNNAELLTLKCRFSLEGI
jgi:hypothetical protein